jgi:hypothetical protein
VIVVVEGERHSIAGRQSEKFPLDRAGHQR